MTCKKCQKNISDGASFCPYCGAAQSEEAQGRRLSALDAPPQAAPYTPPQAGASVVGNPAQPATPAQPAPGYVPFGAAGNASPAPTAPAQPPVFPTAPAVAMDATQTPSSAPAQGAPPAPNMPPQVGAPAPVPVTAQPAAPAQQAPAPPNTAPPEPPIFPAAPPTGDDLPPAQGKVHVAGTATRLYTKTQTDTVCGGIFLALGILCIVYFGIYLFTLIQELAALFPGFTLTEAMQSLFSFKDLQQAAVPRLFYAAGSLCAIVSGILLVAGGAIALRSGRGAKAANAAVALMLFTLLFDVLALVMMAGWRILPGGSLASALLSSLFAYLLEIVVVLGVTILLAVKRRAKRQLRQPPPAPVAVAVGAGTQPAAAAVAQQPPPVALQAAKQQAKAEKKAARASEKQAKAEAKAAKAAQKHSQAEMDVVKAAERQTKAEEAAGKAAERQEAARQHARQAAEEAAAMQAAAEEAARKTASLTPPPAPPLFEGTPPPTTDAILPTGVAGAPDASPQAPTSPGASSPGGTP